MIRPTTVLCLLAACGSGLYLYGEKHRTELLDRDIGRVVHATEAARARTGVLRAEWALLNEPGRLGDMAGRYLTLHPMAPTQWVQLANLSAHLPAPLPNAPDSAGDDPDEAPPAAASLPAAVTAKAAPASIVAKAAPASIVAKAAPSPLVASIAPAAPATSSETTPQADVEAKPAAPKLLASNAAHPRVPRHAVPALDRQDLAASQDSPLAAPQPVGASVYSAMARPMRSSTARSRPALVSGMPSYTARAQAYAAPIASPVSSGISSALGGGGSLPPPVPFGR